MGDISEMRGLVVVITFLGVFAILAATIPSGFVAPAKSYTNVSVPSGTWQALDLPYFSSTWNITLNATTQYSYFKVGGHDIRFDTVMVNATHKAIAFTHFTYHGIFPIQWIADMDAFYVSHEGLDVVYDGISPSSYLGSAIMDDDYASTGRLIYKWTCAHTGFTLSFGWNTALYPTPSEAWENNNLEASVGMTFDQEYTSTNAWNLIGMILFFQAPEIHPALNALIALPMWACVAYLAYIFILRAVGAVFGGGGA